MPHELDNYGTRNAPGKSGRTTRLHSHVDSFKEPGVTWSTIEPQPTKACSAIAKTVTGSSSASMRRLVSGRLLPDHSAPISERALLSYSPLAPYRQNSIREICSGTEAAEHVRRKCPSGSNERSRRLRVPDRTSLSKTESNYTGLGQRCVLWLDRNGSVPPSIERLKRAPLSPRRVVPVFNANP